MIELNARISATVAARLRVVKECCGGTSSFHDPDHIFDLGLRNKRGFE